MAKSAVEMGTTRSTVTVIASLKDGMVPAARFEAGPHKPMHVRAGACFCRTVFSRTCRTRSIPRALLHRQSQQKMPKRKHDCGDAEPADHLAHRADHVERERHLRTQTWALPLQT